LVYALDDCSGEVSEMTENIPVADKTEHAEESYDAWFLRMAKEGLAEADGADAVWFSHEQVMAESKARREELQARITKEKAG
jgi:hypothetical protein